MRPINKILREFEEAQNLDDPTNKTRWTRLPVFMIFGAGTLAALSIVALLVG